MEESLQDLVILDFLLKPLVFIQHILDLGSQFLDLVLLGFYFLVFLIELILQILKGLLQLIFLNPKYLQLIYLLLDFL